MLGGNDKEKMHPQDTRNLFLFFILAALLYFSYDAFVLKPQTQALKQQRLAQQEILREHPELAPKPETPPKPREEVLAESGRVEIKNAEIFGSISLSGARIDDISFQNHYEMRELKNHVVLLSPQGTVFPRSIEAGWIAAEGALAVPGPDAVWRAEGNAKLSPGAPVTLAWDNGQGLKFFNVYEIDDQYLITLTQKVVNNSGKSVTLMPHGVIEQKGLAPDFQPLWISHEGPVGYAGSRLYETSYAGIRKEPLMAFQADNGWVGLTDKYWQTSLIPQQGQAVSYQYTYQGTPPKSRKEKDTGVYKIEFTGAPVVIPAGATGETKNHVFAGVKKVLMLNDYSKKLGVPGLDLAVDFGWFWFITKPFFYLLHYLSWLTGNFGVALILMTIIVRGAVFPLTNISYTSFAKMKKVGPQVADMRKAYGDDKKKLQEELMKLYEREGVNPMAGCLPIFVQIPIFFSLYKTLVTTIEMRHAPFFGWIHDLSMPDPTNVFNLFGLIPWVPPSFLHIGAWPCILLIMFLLQRQLNPPPQDAISRDMNRYYPFLMMYLMAKFASGLVIYWTFSAFIGITQQIIIMRRLGVPIYLFGETEEEKEMDKLVAEGPGVHPLADMAEKKVEEALFGDEVATDPSNPDAPRTVVSAPKPRRKKKK